MEAKSKVWSCGVTWGSTVVYFLGEMHTTHRIKLSVKHIRMI